MDFPLKKAFLHITLLVSQPFLIDLSNVTIYTRDKEAILMLLADN